MYPDYSVYRSHHWCGWHLQTSINPDSFGSPPPRIWVLCCPLYWRRRQGDLAADFWKGVDEMKREQAAAQKRKGKFEHPGDPFLSDLPFLAQFLCDAWWDDGKPRDVCTLTLRFGERQATISLNDVAEERSVSTTADSIGEACRLLDDALGTERAAWRSWKRQKRS